LPFSLPFDNRINIFRKFVEDQKHEFFEVTRI